MRFEVIDDSYEWKRQFDLIPSSLKDVYFMYDYNHLHEVNGEGLSKAAAFKGDNGAFILYPFLLTPINGYNKTGFYNIQSSYGYGGPISYQPNKQDLDKFEIEFHNWCISNSVVAEFVRFHPMLDNQKLFNNDIAIEKNRSTVTINLLNGIDSIWENSISSKNRNVIRKAQKAGIQIKKSVEFSNFIYSYSATMQRLGADQYYYFSEKYFEELIKLNDKNLFLLEAVMDGETIASALFLYGGEILHYHLAGSDLKYLSYAPNNLLIFEACRYGIEMGLKKFHLGGGRTNSQDDSLFKFKNSFSKDTLEFYIGKRIHDKSMYDYFMGEWETRHKEKHKLFLQYAY